MTRQLLGKEMGLADITPDNIQIYANMNIVYKTNSWIWKLSQREYGQLHEDLIAIPDIEGLLEWTFMQSFLESRLNFYLILDLM